MPMSKTLLENDKNANFFESVYLVVALIPHGKITSYGGIARYLGSARSSRMVGWAMNNAHGLDTPVPAHRVVNRNGLLTGKAHFSNPNEMANRLREEGLEVIDDQIINFESCYWDPNIELRI
ncbi:MAG: methylated-DNA-protein-cysteine methyltransferase-like protein [Bacteroidia bacterium]|jgi:methylated-DNA-protein-cysteine methyltransferase-like protein